MAKFFIIDSGRGTSKAFEMTGDARLSNSGVLTTTGLARLVVDAQEWFSRNLYGAIVLDAFGSSITLNAGGNIVGTGGFGIGESNGSLNLNTDGGSVWDFKTDIISTAAGPNINFLTNSFGSGWKMDSPIFSGASISLGNSPTNRIGFYGSGATVQRSGPAQASVVTTAPVSGAYGYTSGQANSIITLLNEIRATLVEKGLMKGSA